MLAQGFPTASGKFELYSLEIGKIREQYPDCGLDCLPVYREPICAAEQEKYPFIPMLWPANSGGDSFPVAQCSLGTVTPARRNGGSESGGRGNP